MKINESYIITETDIRYRDLDVVATIKIVEGEYKDVEFHFGEIRVPEEENEDKTFTISFNYEIISEHKHLKKNQEFEKVLGEIMNDLLHHSLTEAEKRYNDELREKNTQTSDIG